MVFTLQSNFCNYRRFGYYLCLLVQSLVNSIHGSKGVCYEEEMSVAVEGYCQRWCGCAMLVEEVMKVRSVLEGDDIVVGAVEESEGHGILSSKVYQHLHPVEALQGVQLIVDSNVGWSGVVEAGRNEAVDEAGDGQ